MRLATVTTPYGTQAVRLADAPVTAATAANAATTTLRGVELDFEDVGALLRSGDWRTAAEMSGPEVEFAVSQLAPVIPEPGKIICIGLNYAKHIREMGREFPDCPTLFIKFPEALTGPYDDVVIPDYAQAKLDYEGELAVIMGRRAHRVAASDALDYVAGYAIINDYTLRDFQRATTQFHAGKSFYRTAGFGPWLTTDWAPGGHVRLRTTVNGEVRQDDDTDDLIFSVAQLIEFCSQLYPLNPGDVIATGTPEGVGFARGQFLGDGDVTRISIEGLGAIENRTRFDADGGNCSCGGDCSCAPES